MKKLESNADHNYAYPLWRKSLIVFVTSWTTLAATFSSTSLFSAASEIAKDFGTTQEKVNLSSAGILLAMGFSSFVWGPIGIIIGRRFAYNSCIVVLFLFTIGAALAPNMRTFVVMRVLSGLQGTYFHVSGQVILAEYFPPIQRGTATGFFLAGTVLGPPFGPLVAGIIVTYQSWRVILWLQAAMVGVSFILAMTVIPYNKSREESKQAMSILEMLDHFNPKHVFGLMIYPNIFFTDLACGLLSWTQYSLLSAPRHIITERFNLTSPLVSGLFYISPAAGFLAGTMIGGKYSDMTVRKWIDKRGGVRLPQDRLNSGMFSFFFLVPVTSLVYGWCLQADKGGLPLPVIMAFFTAGGLMAAFASLNTYCAEAMPRKRAQVVAAKYCVQYTFSAVTSGASVPMIDAIGVGPTCTISAVFVLIGGVLTMTTAKYGMRMQDWVDVRIKRKPEPEKPQLSEEEETAPKLDAVV
ncbi:uncharacterized protein K452DRAFT_230155 [Aplosporella prunicola CBS 121167]|uniref:Major facilitator superfamily (MFS) profile domain-containing protein n=1 Tax=Aplosporella prunicola CBS 121167 TaxID=1176127 RepID=A0A6A6B907_9PEZI|nr:uncharacterized protein K452DRAFT_230155 [Aplosporella prunicola CBS 121167]KAF2140446.1 hypothetical protein K452DRAFT_230155 [Aplosporella prunicola CBS 121167]